MKFRFKMKKVGKTTRPFRHEVNPVPYDYAVEVRNRFKGLDLTDIVLDELWSEVRDIVQETGIQTIHIEKKCPKAKRLSVGGGRRGERGRRSGGGGIHLLPGQPLQLCPDSCPLGLGLSPASTHFTYTSTGGQQRLLLPRPAWAEVLSHTGPLT